MKSQKEYNHCHKSVSCQECDSDALCRAWINFVDRHDDIKPYAHFDRRVSLAMPFIRNYIMNKDKIAAHSFYPFIHFEKEKKKFNAKDDKIIYIKIGGDEKGNKDRKKREICYCSHFDRCVYQRYAFLLNYYYNIFAKDNNIDDNAIAYRDNIGKNNIYFAKKAFDSIQNFSKCFVLVGDFKGFFDRIDHQYLKQMICKVLGVERLEKDYFSVFKNITRYSWWDWKDIVKSSGEVITTRGLRKIINSKDTILTKEQFNKNKKYIKKNLSGVGIPQGSPISAVLSNIYMVDFDKDIKKYVTDNNGIYMRYSDDFIIIIPFNNMQTDIEKYKNFILSYINSMKDKVELEENKTLLYVYKNNKIYKDNKNSNINYLGFVFDGSSVKIRPKAITKYYYRMRRKAHTIGRCNWISPKGNHISAKKLYGIYSKNKENKQTFIDYIKKSKDILNINDQEADALLKRHKHKIAMAIREGMTIKPKK